MPQDLSHLRHDHLVVWDLLNRELQRVLEYVEPVKQNADVYSFRICDLILRTCMEFEAVCRDAVSIVIGDPTPRHKMKVGHYFKLRDFYNLSRYDVGVMFWRPKVYVDPFGPWWGPNPNLPWWNRHHALKHDRHTNFHDATLLLLVECMAGLFALMTHTELLSTDQDHKETVFLGTDGSFEDIHKRQLFSLRGTPSTLQRFGS